MSASGCNPFCGCLSLKSAVRTCAVTKGVVSLFSCGVFFFLIYMCTATNSPEVFWKLGFTYTFYCGCTIPPFCTNFILIEVLNVISSIVLFCLAGKPTLSSLYLPCIVMNFLNVFYLIWVILGCHFVKEFSLWFVGNFAPSAMLTIYTTFVVGWKVIQENDKSESTLAAAEQTEEEKKDKPSSENANDVTSSAQADQVEPYEFPMAAPVAQPQS